MSSVSAIFGLRLAVRAPPLAATTSLPAPPQRSVGFVGTGGGNGLVIECSSRPQKKATAHHRKTRPRKTNPSDRRHGPAVYPPLPPLPSEWSLLVSENLDNSSSSDPQVVAAVQTE